METNSSPIKEDTRVAAHLHPGQAEARMPISSSDAPPLSLAQVWMRMCPKPCFNFFSFLDLHMVGWLDGITQPSCPARREKKEGHSLRGGSIHQKPQKVQFSSSSSVVMNAHGLQHARPPYPSPAPRACSELMSISG